NKIYSEQTSERIDKAVHEIITRNYKRTKELLSKHRDQLETMADTLLEKEVIDHNDLKELLGEHPEGKYPEGIFDNSLTGETNGQEEHSGENEDTADENQDNEATESSTEGETV